MSISDLYTSYFIKTNKAHFASIVRVAMSDGILSDKEQEFLNKLAFKLNISSEEYEDILKNYLTHPINPPLTYERRLERLYDLARMVYANDDLGERQPAILERLCIGLGFNTHNAKYIVDKALILVSNGIDLDDFADEIKNMNR